MKDRETVLLDSLVRPGLRSCSSPPSSPSRHQLISKRRADRDRVTKAELERELFLSGLASIGEQSEAARVIGVTEGALRHWRDLSMTKSLPPRWAIARLRDERAKPSNLRRLAG